MTKILLVGDDPLHASVRKAILQRKYEDVRRVGDAAEALCLLEQPLFSQDLAIVVTSDMHTGIGLESFVAELHTRMPNLPVLIIGENGRNGSNTTDPRVRFLKRPIAADELLSVVGEMMSPLAQSHLKTA
jgi:DNA-binding NtrC family response regulator